MRDFTQWGADRRGWSPETRRCYAARVRQAERWHGGPIVHCDTDQLHAWLDTVPPDPQTRNTYRSALIAYYDWLQATGVRDDNPARAIGRIRQRPAVPRALPPDVIAAINDAARRQPHRDRDAATHLMTYAGLRISEVATLQWADVEDGWLRVTGKGRRTRMLPVHPHLADALAGWRAGSVSAQWLFPSDRRRGPVSTQTVRRWVQDIAFGVGVRGFVPHMARHSAATRLLECGADVATVSAFLGHSSVQVTSVYLRVRPQRLAEAVAALGYEEAA